MISLLLFFSHFTTSSWMKKLFLFFLTFTTYNIEEKNYSHQDWDWERKEVWAISSFLLLITSTSVFLIFSYFSYMMKIIRWISSQNKISFESICVMLTRYLDIFNWWNAIILMTFYLWLFGEISWCVSECVCY